VNGSGVRIPPPPSAGGNILAWCVEAYKTLRKTRPRAGVGMRETQTEDGVILSAIPVEEVTSHPFKITAAPYESGVGFDITIAYGTVNNSVPTFWGNAGSPLSTSSPPVYVLAATVGTHNFYLVVVVDKNGAMTDVYIESATSLPANVVPVPDDMPDAGDTGTSGLYHFSIGTVTIAGSGSSYTATIDQSITNSLTYWTCSEVGRIVSV